MVPFQHCKALESTFSNLGRPVTQLISYFIPMCIPSFSECLWKMQVVRGLKMQLFIQESNQSIATSPLEPNLEVLALSSLSFNFFICKGETIPISQDCEVFNSWIFTICPQLWLKFLASLHMQAFMFRVCSWHHIKPFFIEGSLICIRLLWAQLLSHGCKCGNNLLQLFAQHFHAHISKAD